MPSRIHPLVVIEGIDRSGKSRHAKGLVDWFIADNQRAFYRHFPNYESLTGKAIARHLKKEWAAATAGGVLRDPVDELVFQCLMTVNRYEDAKEMTEQLRQGVVVCDRFSPSSRVYGRINDLPAAFLDGIQERLPQPDVCILIDIPVSEARRRRSDLLDRYEEMDDMQERARSEYLQLFRNNGWHVVDGTESYETVQRRVRECIPQAMALREQD